MGDIARNKVEAVRLSLWHAISRPPDAIEVAGFVARLRKDGFEIRPTTDPGAVEALLHFGGHFEACSSCNGPCPCDCGWSETLARFGGQS